MRGGVIAPLAAVVVGMLTAAPGAADTSWVDHTEWALYNGVPGVLTLRVYPTALARAVSAKAAGPEADWAWRELVAGTPDADTPGMREQFVCHWRFAELARPGKISWNLEPWRPVVDDATMLDAGCNPGAPEESF